MATVIDAFLATLGIDGRAFKAGMKDAEKSQDDLTRVSDKNAVSREKIDAKSASDMRKRQDEQTKNTQKNVQARNRAESQLSADERKRQAEQNDRTKFTVDGFRTVRNELLTLAAIFTGGVGVKDFISNTINSAANLKYLSENFGMSTESLTSWSRAAERAGGSSNDMLVQIKESAETLAQLRSGLGPNDGLQWFFRMGGSSSDLKDGNSYLLARSKIVADLFKTDPTRAALISKQMGIAEDQFNFIKQGPDAILALVKAQEKNASVTAKDAQAALDLRNKVLDLRDSFQSTATRVVLQFAPALERLFAKFEKGAQWVADHKDDIFKWCDNAIVAITALSQTLDRGAQAVGGWKNVLILLAAIKVASIVPPLLSLAAGLVSVGTALAGVAAGAGGVAVLAAAAGALAAYGGYKAAEAIFGEDEEPKRKPLAPSPLKSRSQLRIEADKQRAEVGLPALEKKPLAEIVRDDIEQGLPRLKSKPQLREEANRQRVALGFDPLPEQEEPPDAARVRTERATRRKEAGLPAENRPIAEVVHDDIAKALPRLKSKPQLREEANQQRVDLGLPPLDPDFKPRQMPEVKPPPDRRDTYVPSSKKPLVAERNGVTSEHRLANDPAEVIAKLRKLGWTHAQAAGITASFVQESDLDPERVNPKSGAYGIGQWLGGRVDDFKKWSGKDLRGSSLDEQLRFFHYEVTQGKEQLAGDKLRTSTTAQDAARVHSEAYERPGADEANIARRQRIAGDLDQAGRLQNALSASRVPAGAVATAPITHTANHTSTATSETKIGEVNIYTQATDANSMAKDARPALEKYTFATQANTGVQ